MEQFAFTFGECSVAVSIWKQQGLEMPLNIYEMPVKLKLRMGEGKGRIN